MFDLGAVSAGIMMSGKKAVITPLSVSKNGTYTAAEYGCDGFDPVNVNVPTYEKELADAKKEAEEAKKAREAAEKNLDNAKAEIQSLFDYIEKVSSADGNTKNSIGVITGFDAKCNVDGVNHSYSFKTLLGDFVSGGGYGAQGDMYRANILIYKDGEYQTTISTTIPARSAQSSLPTAENFGDCFYWTTDESGAYATLHYRYFRLGSWASYDQWNEAAYATT